MDAVNADPEITEVSSAEIVKFREMIEMHIERKDPPMNTVPEEHKPLIAKLVHERSVKSVVVALPLNLTAKSCY